MQMINILGGLIAGAVIGFICSLAIYLLSGIFEILNCAWQIISCQCNFDSVLPVWSSGTFWKIALFCAIAGAVIGIIYGIFENIQERKNREAAARASDAQREAEQRQIYAKELQKEIAQILNKVLKIQTELKTFDLESKYFGPEGQKNAWDAMRDMELSEVQLSDIINEYKL